ncbi:hypothetical protein DPEC_G00331950 [Dallia pectoralis]|uniref:Uncharacterized protein n=1 Tax=Dallia pectoralis TaxID=75939 RepID=A0ACC2F610_DALPE|nr:hypothetical protein DPEC_G00331950 [Dallia pectoralis]
MRLLQSYFKAIRPLTQQNYALFMKPVQYVAICMFLSLVCAVQVQTAPVPDDWTGMGTVLISRAKRSLLWRWNTLKPVGAGCREHAECGTNYCRKNMCSFHGFTS